MEVQAVLEKAKAQALKDLEVLLKNQVELVLEDALLVAKDKLKEAIPGQVDDAIIEIVMAALVPVLKQAIVAQVEKVAA